MVSKLSKKEAEFCKYYVNLRSSREAALMAGYTLMPGKSGEKLLLKNEIRKEIARLSEEAGLIKNEALAGFRRLAFGSAVKAERKQRK